MEASRSRAIANGRKTRAKAAERPAKGAPERKERRTHAERREEAERSLLQAAVRMVAEKGLERFTLSDVGEAAGYSRGLPRHYYGTKEDLIAAVAAHIIERYRESLDARTSTRTGLGGLLDGLAFYLDSAARGPGPSRALLVILSEALTKPSLVPSMARVTRASRKGLVKQIQAGIDAGEIRADIDPQTQAVLLLAQLRGIVTQWLIDPKGVDIKAARDELLASVERSLRA